MSLPGMGPELTIDILVEDEVEMSIVKPDTLSHQQRKFAAEFYCPVDRELLMGDPFFHNEML